MTKPGEGRAPTDPSDDLVPNSQRMPLGEYLIGRVEGGRVPDVLIRAGVRAIVAARLRRERRRDPGERGRFWDDAWAGPIALQPERANDQHYEVPPEFFKLVLGPHLKYSCALWSDGERTLGEAEESMLELYADRAGLRDGQSILDLGCGWGSFALWSASRYPRSTVVAVSNSAGQRLHIEREARARGIENLEVTTADINEFDPGRKFDRIVSVEMLEHVRNHRALFRRLAGWIEPDGAVFIHTFAHREFAYAYETGGAADWMARTFFTGGVMPSQMLIPQAARPFFSLDSHWWVDGTHYQRTCNAWLRRLDARSASSRDVLKDVYEDDVDVWLQRWRIFFMACAEMFGYAGGQEWGVAHCLLRPTTTP